MILLLLTTLFFDQYAAAKIRARQLNNQSYSKWLPQFSMGYISDLPIPSMNFPHLVKPTKIMKTKVFNMVTKYVHRSPICVKISGKKSPCEKVSKDANSEYTITKGIQVKHRDNEKINEFSSDDQYLPPFPNILDFYIETSENPKSFSQQSYTPSLTKDGIQEMLIEDRLDQLESILPHYTRRRLYETTTVTVTKVKDDNIVTATLLAKNCVPQGYPLCPPKSKKRKSKVAQWAESSSENFYG